ncbi:MAG: lambda exonuclease family protein [Candidatus Omnitrophota bacterium]
MRIINCLQQSEEWIRWRNRPTASEFDKFITPAKGQYSASATAYAAKIVAKRLGVYTEPPPTFWMQWGTEMEPNAKHAYTLQTGRAITDVGFIIPDNTDAYGGSPDGLVGDDGGIEIKCPAPETLIAWHADGELPLQHKPQVQGHLFISGRNWWDFYAFHPELTPFLLRVEPDEKYMAAIADGLLKLLREIARIEACVGRQRHEIVSLGTQQDKVRFTDD